MTNHHLLHRLEKCTQKEGRKESQKRIVNSKEGRKQRKAQKQNRKVKKSEDEYSTGVELKDTEKEKEKEEEERAEPVKKKRKYNCSKCKEAGQNAKKCPLNIHTHTEREKS